MKKIVVFLVVTLLISVFTDIQNNKIPNWLIFIGILVGTLTTQDLLGSVIRFLVVIIFFFPFFSVGAMGAGDVKCIAMTGFYLTKDQLMESILYIFLIAAVFALLKIVHEKWLRARIAHFFSSYWQIFHCHTVFSYETGISDKKEVKHHTIHLALPIFFGVLLSVGGTFL